MNEKMQNIIIVIGSVLLFGGGFWAGWHFKQCPEIASVKVEIRDSVIKNKSAPIIIGGQPKLVAVRKYKETNLVVSEHSGNNVNQIADSGNMVSSTGIPNSCIDSTHTKIAQVESLCMDTNVYEKEYFHPDSFKAKYYAEVAGNKLIKLEITFQDLKPIHVPVINTTNTLAPKKSLVKVYAVAYGKANFNSKIVTGGGAGGGFDFIIKDKVLLGLSAGANIQPLQPITGEAMLRCGVGIGIK